MYLLSGRHPKRPVECAYLARERHATDHELHRASATTHELAVPEPEAMPEPEPVPAPEPNQRLRLQRRPLRLWALSSACSDLSVK